MNVTTSLNGFLASLVLRDITKNDRGSDEYVLFSDYMVRAAFLFEIGAVLGHTFRDRLPIFVQLFAAPGAEQNIISFLRELAVDRLAALDGKPTNFNAVYFAPEATQLIGILRRAGLTDASDWREMHKVASQAMRVADISTQLQIAPPQGVGFGSCYPELTSDLLTSEIDGAKYQELRTAGLAVPPTPPKAKIMPQRQEMALSMIRPYVQHARPDLLVALGL